MRERERDLLIIVVHARKEGKKTFVNNTIYQRQLTPPHLQAEAITRANSQVGKQDGTSPTFPTEILWHKSQLPGQGAHYLAYYFKWRTHFRF